MTDTKNAVVGIKLNIESEKQIIVPINIFYNFGSGKCI